LDGETNTMAQIQLSGLTKFHPVCFSDKEISMFNSVSCNNMFSVSTDISNEENPLWVNFAILTNFAKLYIYYWNRAVHVNTALAIEQRAMLWNILVKITHIFSLAARYECAVGYWIDLRKLLKAALAIKKENLFLALHPHQEYDILEIEKVGLEFSKTEIGYDIVDETKIKDLIMLSKLMALQLHGFQIK